jgi:putative lipoprotein
LLVALMTGGGAMATDEPVAPALAVTTWRAETIMGRPVIDSATSTLTFEPDGRVSGRGACNRYFGTSTIPGEQLAFGAIGVTKCAPALVDQETRFFQALGSAARWTIERGWPAADLFRRRG